MGKYRIKNLTDSFGKRDADYNKVVSFQVSNGLMKKTITIEPGDELYIELKILPLDLQRLRIKNIVTVTEIGNLEFNSRLKAEQNKNKPVQAKETKPEIVEDSQTIATLDELSEDIKTSKTKKDKNS